MRIYAYLRASSKEQDAERAKQDLTAFAQDRDLTLAHCFIENESGATLSASIDNSLGYVQTNTDNEYLTDVFSNGQFYEFSNDTEKLYHEIENNITQMVGVINIT